MYLPRPWWQKHDTEDRFEASTELERLEPMTDPTLQEDPFDEMVPLLYSPVSEEAV